MLHEHLKFNMSKMDFMLSLQTAIFSDQHPHFPSWRKSGVVLISGSPHSFSSSTNVTIFTPPPKIYLLAAHFFPSPLLSPYFKPPNLSPGCCDMLLLGLPISTFASLQFISLYSKSDQLKR